MSVPKTLRGADLQLYINGRLFAICTGIRFEASAGRHAIYGIDQFTPFELAPGAASIKGTVDCVRIRASGGLEGAGVAAPESLLMQEKYFSMALVDRLTDTIVLQVEAASLDAQNWQVAAKGEMAGSFSFTGLTWVNEAGQ
jgi:hypothetical protein